MPPELDQIQTAVWIYDIDNACIYWANKAGLAFWNSPSLQALRQRDFKSGASHAVTQTLLKYQEDFKQNKKYRENWFFMPNDREVEAFCQISGFVLEDGRMGMLVEAIAVDESVPTALLNNSMIISSFTPEGQFISGNPPFLKEYGEKLFSLNELFVDAQAALRLIHCVNQGQEFDEDSHLKSLNGEQWYRVHAALSGGVDDAPILLVHLHNINERKIFELSLQKQAVTDPLTQLLNRRGLHEIIEHTISEHQPGRDRPFTLLYIDLDGFKMVNDSYGHSVGDRLLVDVARRLSDHCDERSLLSRFGGDEFILYIPGNVEASQIASLCNSILDDLATPFDGIPVNSLSASIGTVSFPQDATTIDTMISRADAAMYHAKNTGKKQFVIYQQGMELGLKRTSDISGKLAKAITNNQLCLHYQPIIDRPSGELVSFEALLRWHDDDLGYINPEEAVTIAENTGLIQPLEQWVLTRALRDLCTLRQWLNTQVSMAVNMSGLHLSRPGAADAVIRLIDDLGLSPYDLTIELTENVLIDNLDNESCQARELARRGVHLSIDDFGTGYSSLAYLHLIPATTLKVDKMFTDNAERHRVTLECIGRLSEEFNITCLIEGIETLEQSTILSELGFHLQQGYLFGRPQPLEYYRQFSHNDLAPAAQTAP